MNIKFYISLLLGLAIFGYGLTKFIFIHQFKANAVLTKARVVEIITKYGERQVSGGRRSATRTVKYALRTMKVAYQDLQGASHTHIEGDPLSKYSRGDEIEIYFDSRNPEVAMEYPDKSQMYTLGFIIIGVLITFMTVKSWRKT